MFVLRQSLLLGAFKMPTMGYMGRKRFCSDDDFKKQSKVQVTNENAQ